MKLQTAFDRFIEATSRRHSPKTAQSYYSALRRFGVTLTEHGKDPADTNISSLRAEWVSWLIEDLIEQEVAISTLDLYCAALIQFYEEAEYKQWADVSAAKVRKIVLREKPRNGKRQIRVDLEAMDQMLEHVRIDPPQDDLVRLRDRAFVYALATTGLRVQEALALTVGDIDFQHRRSVIVGKGDKQAEIYWSPQALDYMSVYLDARGNPPQNSPIFVRHDDPNNEASEALSSMGAWNLVRRVAPGTSPHKWRHYAISRYLIATNDLRGTQEFARHANPSTTMRYSHLIEDQVQEGHRKAFQ